MPSYAAVAHGGAVTAENRSMDDSPSLDTGDTVRLTIGGPLMTILSVTDRECCCVWFGESARLEHGSFELEMIELVERGVRLIPSDRALPGAPTARRTARMHNSPRAS